MESREPRTIRFEHRFDFIQEVLSHDDARHTVEVQLKPDPQRYDQVRKVGVTGYHNRFLGVRHTLSTMAAGLGGSAPMFASNETVNSPLEFAAKGREALAAELNGEEHSPPRQAAPPHAPPELADSVREIFFLSVDFFRANALRAKDRLAFDRALDLLLRELASWRAGFDGAAVGLPDYEVPAVS